MAVYQSCPLQIAVTNCGFTFMFPHTDAYRRIIANLTDAFVLNFELRQTVGLCHYAVVITWRSTENSSSSLFICLSIYLFETSKLQIQNINYCVRGGHKPARWPWRTSRLTEIRRAGKKN